MKTKPKTQPPLPPADGSAAEDRALECLVALALRIDIGEVTQTEIDEYMHKPVNLSAEDRAALKRAHPKLLEALREELRPDAKRIMRVKPPNAKVSEGGTTKTQNRRLVRRQWEYLDAQADDVRDRDELGRRGWELVAVSVSQSPGHIAHRIYHFKRESPNARVSDPATPR